MKGLTVSVCASTNELAKELAREKGVLGAPHGFWVSADQQTEGRGRWGRKWESLEGNLFLSVILRPKSVDHWTWIPIAASLAVIEALHSRWPELKLTLKWPNDLWLDGKKLAGILCESVSCQGSETFLVLGLGLNVLSAPKELDQETAALGLSNTGALFFLREGLSEKIAQYVDRLDQEGSAWVETLFWAHSHFKKGSEIRWSSGNGKVLSLGKHGELWVDSLGKALPLYAEEIKALRSGGD